ncbi:hypothetical protein RSA46_14980 [Pseudomonas oryzihabitans]|nr:hypothetical protein RSA46_14980 [Pseudomonas psychrotolerans]
MKSLPEQILSELRQLLQEMSDGGSVGPSIYDTAIHLRSRPDPAQRSDAYHWLLSQQQADGGWGSPDFPLFRHVPTLAAMLALQQAEQLPHGAEAVQAAREFLTREPDPYQHLVPEDAPIGAELILPHLSDEAASRLAGFAPLRLAALRPLGQARLAKLATLAALPTGHPLLHSWEAWGEASAAVSPDANGSIGISPSATAVWRARALAQGFSAQDLEPVEAYLRAAARGTRTGIEAVLPNVWPIDVFEPCWALYTLHLGGLFAHPQLAGEVQAAVSRIAGQLNRSGLGPASYFAAEADDTSLALCVLSLAGRQPSVEPLRQFESGELFVTFPGERNASVSTNIHALHAMRLLGRSAPGACAFVEANRSARGLWESDKWHVSWTYPTAHAVAALAQGSPEWRDERTLAALLDAQHGDGGWGSGRSATFEETAYALFALRVMSDREEPARRRHILSSVERALDWMLGHYAPGSLPETPLWIGKELYCPLRVVRVTELAGLWLALGWLEQSNA